MLLYMYIHPSIHPYIQREREREKERERETHTHIRERERKSLFEPGVYVCGMHTKNTRSRWTRITLEFSLPRAGVHVWWNALIYELILLQRLFFF
jgi:hypothetical protein